MVQRKVSNKLSIKVDDIKANNKQMLNNLKPSCSLSQNHDVKNRGGDLKKKMMKKSGKTKYTEFENFRSPNSRSHVPLLGKPPPQPPPPLLLSTPKKQQHMSPSPIKGSESTPNYMKSTSSSVARKEQSQVSSRTPQTYSPDTKSCSRKNSHNSKLGGSDSGNKLTRSLVRTLTKTHSFKPTRVTTKNRSQLVLCEDLDVQRSTCSSTLKEAKFPSYLELSPGGTESDGTSVFKVCPYTYCSLNGHHHPPLPPLKSFLSARRRTLKTQRNFKLGCLSPRRAKPNGLCLNDNAPKQEPNSADVAPLTSEDATEYFVEIYSKEREDMADIMGRRTNSIDDYDSTDEGSEEVAAEYGYGQLSGDEAADNLDRNGESVSAETGITDLSLAGYLSVDDAEEVYLPPLVKEEEADVGCWSVHDELEVEETAEELESEASDKDWELWKYYAYIEGEIDAIENDIDPNTMEDDSDVSEEFTSESLKPEFLLDNTLEESLDTESIISETSYGYDESQSPGYQTELDIDESVTASDPQVLPHASENGNEDTSCKSIDILFILDGETTEKSEDEHAFFLPDSDAAIMDHETFCLEDEVPTSHDECRNLQDDDASAHKGYQELNSCNFNEVRDESCKDNVGDQKCRDEVIRVQLDDSETETNYSGKGNEKGHAYDDKQLLVGGDLNSKINVDHTSLQAEDGIEIVSGMEEDITAQAYEKKANHTKDAPTFKVTKSPRQNDLSEELSESHRNLRGIARRKLEEPEESREFNPRAPNFLPLDPDPEAEKVDLKHQMMDDRKNSEDWMVDAALRRAVDKLAPARKRKVALLVEAFETVMPIPKWEPHLRRSAAAFAHPRPIQACN